MKGEMNMSFDIEMLADKTMETLNIAPGKVVWIWAGTKSIDFIEALAYRIRRQGAFWTLRLTSGRLSEMVARNLPDEYLSLVPGHELKWLSDIDMIVEVRDQGSQMQDIPLSRRRAMAAEWIALVDEAHRLGRRFVTVMNPSSELAAAYGIPVEQLQERYSQAINIDYSALAGRQSDICARLSAGDEVHITSSLGTDLRFRIKGRPIYLDNDSIPRGEVYIAPHEDSARGLAVIDKTFLVGKPFDKLRLIFHNGRVVDFAAPDPDGAKRFRKLLEVSSGDKDSLGELGIGLNPGIGEPTGDIMLDEKIYGSVHIALGMNEAFGGRNKSNLHLDLVILRPDLLLDGKPLIRNGEFVA